MKNVLHRIILIMIVIGIIAIAVTMNGIGEYSIYLDDNLELFYNNENLHVKSISDSKVKLKKKGDIIVIKAKLPENIPDRSTMSLISYHSVINVNIDGRQIYEYGRKYKEKDVMIGDGMFYVPLPYKSQGREIEIKYEACDNNAFTLATPIKIQESKDVIPSFVRSQFIEVVISSLIFMMGITLIVFILIYGRFKRGYRRILWLGISLVTMGVWMACYYGSITLVVSSNHLVAYIEHYGLFVSLPPILAYYAEEVESNTFKKIYRALILLIVVFILSVVFSDMYLHIHANHFLRSFYCIAVISLAVLVISVVKNGVMRGTYELTILGVVSLGISFVVEMVIYMINESMTDVSGYRVPVVPVGVLIFVIVEMISYLKNIIKYSQKQVEEELLYKMANRDILTGLANRNACEKYMQDMKQEEIKEYSIINFDLNWLKKMNDEFGHVVGDEYIIKFSELLKEFFENCGIIGRMGGDEFIAITKNLDEKNICDRIEEMTKKSETYGDKEYADGRVFFAYGYAVSTESNPMDVEKAFELADQRMYECKKNQKAGRA